MSSTARSKTVVSEKKPLIKFALNVPRVAQTEALPGFTKLLAAKQDKWILLNCLSSMLRLFVHMRQHLYICSLLQTAACKFIYM